MKRMQTLVFGLMAMAMLGALLLPEWNVTWTERLDYEFYYEDDTPLGEDGHARPPVSTSAALIPHAETRRAWLFTGPACPVPNLPPPTAETTGTGFAATGRRITTYTQALVQNYQPRLNTRRMVWEVVILGGSIMLILGAVRPRQSASAGFSTASWPVPAPPPGGTGRAPPPVIRLPAPIPPRKPDPGDSSPPGRGTGPDAPSA